MTVRHGRRRTPGRGPLASRLWAIGATARCLVWPVSPKPRLGGRDASARAGGGLTRRAAVAWAVGAYAVLGLAACLDSSASPLRLQPDAPIRTAAVFGVVVVALEIFAGWVATAAEVTVLYVWAALTWLAGVVGAFLVSTGSMLAKVWDALHIVWSDVLKPALVWLDDKVKAISAWLKDTFAPILEYIKEIKCRIQGIYDTFVKPVVDTIDFIREVNRVLLAFHITVLQELDSILQQIEHDLQAPFLWIEARLTEVQNWINRIVTLDGLLQRITLIKSMSRYAPSWLRIAVASRSKPLSDEDAYKLQASLVPQSTGDVVTDLGRYLKGDTNDTGEVIDAAVERLTAFLNA